MIIEFSALPGSGKTFISTKLKDYLIQNLDSEKYVIYSIDDIKKSKQKEFAKRKNKKLYLFRMVLSIMNFSILKHLFHLLTLSKNIRFNLKYIKFYIRILLNYLTINTISDRDSRTPILIVDEGFLHSSVLFLHKNNSMDNLKQFFLEIHSIEELNYERFDRLNVFIDCHWETNFNRIENRKEGWPFTFQHLNARERKEELKKRVAYYKTLKKYTKKYSDLVIELDNSNYDELDLEHSFSMILDQISTVI